MDYFLESFTKDEIQSKCKTLYDSFIENKNSFEVKFKDLFLIDYKLVFGKQNYKESLMMLLSNFYHNEYFIKQMFMQKILISRKSSICGLEVPVLNSRTDMISVNGKSIAYEIKTELDTTQRLLKQIDDYSKCFDYVYVVCSESLYKKIVSMLPDYCGIYIYLERKNLSFRKVRDANYSSNLNALEILKCLTMKEISENFSSSNLDIISNKYSLDFINDVFKKCLKNKYCKRWQQYKINCSKEDF